jgi:toxin FitB
MFRRVANCDGARRSGPTRRRCLLDTTVVSELRRARPRWAVLAWIESVNVADLHLSAVTIGEIQSGVEVTREQDSAKVAEIDAWLDQVAESSNILPVDGRVFRVWAKLMHRRSDDLMEDAMIAATARVYGLTVVTRNMRDFETLGVEVLNPFAAVP